MFRIDKSTVGSIDSKNPYVMEGLFVQSARPSPPEQSGETPEQEKAAGAMEPELRERQIEAAHTAAANIINDAKSNAQLIIAEAQAAAEQLRAQGWQEGYDKGTAEAEVILKRLREKDVADLNGLIMSAKQAYAKIIDESEFEMLDIAITAAEKIVNHELGNPEIYQSFIENALKRVRTEGKIKIVVDEQTYSSFVQNHGPNSIMRDAVEISVVPNTGYALGDASVSFGDEAIELSVTSQIEEIKRSLGL